jgi:hypothetical protein
VNDGDAGGEGLPRATFKRLVSSLLADPNHAPERFVVAAVAQLGEPALSFAQRARTADAATPPAQLAVQTQADAVRVAGIDGAVSGSPFLVALVPAYVAMLWEQARMTLRIAALHGRDTRDRAIAAELLWLRGVAPDLPSARRAVEEVAAGSRDKPAGKGFARMRAWYSLGQRFLVMAGFIDPPKPGRTTILRRIVSVVALVVVWIITCIVPVTFMLLMAYSSTSSTTALASRARSYYGGATDSPAPSLPRAHRVPRGKRLVRAIIVGVSVAIPLAALAVAATERPAGIHWYYVLIALAAQALVISLSTALARR